MVAIFLELAKAVAGCAICNQPITVGATRVSLRVRLREPATNKNGTPRYTERYNMHPGCLTKPMKPEVVRSSRSCWDCGDEPEGDYRWWEHPVFTTNRFTYSRLCPRCVQKPKWRLCDGCLVFFPAHMVVGVYKPTDTREVQRMATEALESDEPDYVLQNRALIQLRAIAVTAERPIGMCMSCATLSELETYADAAEAKREFEELRERIARVGIDDA